MADETKPVTTHELLAMKERGERILGLTCYDVLFARLLVGASLGRFRGAGRGGSDGRTAEGGCQDAGGGGRLLDRARARPRATRVADHEVAHDPPHRHRRGTRLRRPGVGAPRYAGV